MNKKICKEGVSPVGSSDGLQMSRVIQVTVQVSLGDFSSHRPCKGWWVVSREAGDIYSVSRCKHISTPEKDTKDTIYSTTPVRRVLMSRTCTRSHPVSGVHLRED